MQHATDATDDLITPAAAAKALGLNRSTISRQITRGVIPTHNGLVRLSEVEAGRKDYIDPERSKRSRRNTGATARATEPAAGAIEPAPDAADATRATPAIGATGVARRFALVEQLDDPFDRGAMSLGMLLTYRMGQVTASMAVLAGAPCKVAYALQTVMTVALMGEVTDFAKTHQIGPFAEKDDPAIWNPQDVEPVNWPALAEAAGEPVDRAAWEAFARERFAEADGDTNADMKDPNQ